MGWPFLFPMTAHVIFLQDYTVEWNSNFTCWSFTSKNCLCCNYKPYRLSTVVSQSWFSTSAVPNVSDVFRLQNTWVKGLNDLLSRLPTSSEPAIKTHFILVMTGFSPSINQLAAEDISVRALLVCVILTDGVLRDEKDFNLKRRNCYLGWWKH